jgi:hypothetical protein
LHFWRSVSRKWILKSSKMFSNSNSPWSNYPKTQKNQTLILVYFRSILVYFAFSGTGISVMDHEITKTELKFVFSMVELPKNTEKSNYDFWSISSLFWSFSNFEGPYLGLTLSKSQNFCKNSNSPYQIYPKNQKSPQKSSFGRFSFF